MSLSIQSSRKLAMNNGTCSLPVTSTGIQEDFQPFQMRSVICDFDLSAILFASCGNILLICGKGKQEKQRYFLHSYEIPTTTTSSLTSKKRILKMTRLNKKNITQLETIPMMKIALLLGDGIVSIFDIDSLTEVTKISSNAILFATSFDITSSSSTLTTSASLASSSSSVIVPDILRICVVSQSGRLGFFRWFPQQRRVEEERNLRDTFELFDIPQTIAFSRDRICIGYEKSYVIMSLTTGMIIYELKFTMKYTPVINWLQDQIQWCIQMDKSTMFLDSNFEPLHKNGILWRDIPSALVQVNPYVLAIMNQSIDICTFNGAQSIIVQRISLNNLSTTGKSRLWMDAYTKRIYFATSTDLLLFEPIPLHIQLQKYNAMRRYDIALSIIRTMLDISVSPSNNESSRTNDGHAKGNLDISRMPKVSSSNILVHHQSLSNQPLNQSELWYEYYRVGTMHAFQLFHQQQFQQAFAEFNEFLTDPAETISLFRPLSANTWLADSHRNLMNFVNQHRDFSEPDNFDGITLDNAMRELQVHLTELRRAFQTIHRRSPDTWLEVQSLVQNGLILKPVRELLTIVETALLKTYFIDNNYTLINALLRNEDNCCLPSEVETELIKRSRCAELVSFYRTQNRHGEALQLITSTKSLAFNDTVLDYLSNLDNNYLTLVFHYVQPMIISALQQQNNEEIFTEILILFIGESTSTIKFDPIAVYHFLKDLDQNLTIRYLKGILLELKRITVQQVVNDAMHSSYCRHYQELSDKLNLLTGGKQLNNQTFTYVTPKAISFINVCQGDLITQQIDVIVACSSSQYLFDAIFKAGGDSMKAFLVAERNNKSNDPVIAVKAAGQLISKRVYVLRWEVNSDISLLLKSIKIFVANAITKLVQEGHQSIAFPAIGCGQHGCPVSSVAQAMVEQAHQLSQQHGVSVLFVIQPHKTDVYQEFQKQINSVQQQQQQVPVPTSSTKTVSIPVNKGVIEVEMGYLTTQKVDAIIISSSSESLSNAILKAAADQAEHKNTSHAILTSIPSGVLPSKRTFLVKWQPDADQTKLRQSLLDIIRAAIENMKAYNFTSLAFPALGCGQYGCPMDVVVKTLVDEMKHQLTINNIPLRVKFVIQPDRPNIYDEFCKRLLATQEVDVSRSMNYQMPSTWEKSQDKKIRFVLSNGSYEYKAIATNFDQAMKGTYTHLVRIERIQNERWYIQYLAHSQSFYARLNTNTERSLYHGCPESAVNSILEEGFNRNFAGVNGVLYGVGVYFSLDAVYSHRYTEPNGNGERNMFIARVLIGNTTVGNSFMRTRPVGYDSTTDGKHIFVTYHDTQAYTEYLITYK